MLRINKYLSMCELGSRRKVEELVLLNKITVNGEIVNSLSFVVGDNDIVRYNNKIVEPVSEKVYYMLNKPKCYITSKSDENNRKIVMQLMVGVKYNIFPVGRLDYNTEGLLLLTNDGEFANSVAHPKSKIGKTYEVLTSRELTAKEIKMLKNGVLIDGVKTLPANVQPSEASGNNLFLTTITIFEGKNREVRKMFASLGLKVYNLKRVAIGSLLLGDLRVGKYKKLNSEDLKLIFI